MVVPFVVILYLASRGSGSIVRANASGFSVLEYLLIPPMRQSANFKWVILALAALTNALVVAAPAMSLSVLFPEISRDLQLNLVQVGLVWGIGGLPGALASLLGGAVGDRFGPRRMMVAGTMLAGLAGAARGLAGGFLPLLALVMLAGMLLPVVTMSSFKACGIWFPRRQLGLANGVLSMGMALGFLAGSFLSASLLSPWLGGWRQVQFFYGALAVCFSLPWLFMPAAPRAAAAGVVVPAVPIRQALRQVTRLRDAWLLGLTIFGFGGCIQAMLGYLPLHLRAQGWQPFRADAALSLFHLTSLVCVLPIVLWSDRLGARKRLLIVMGLTAAAGVGWLALAQGFTVWLAVMLAGMTRDGFMALFMTLTIETEGVGATYAGTATGFNMVFSGLGSLLAPPLGNKLAEVSAGMPFFFWACLALGGVIFLSLTRAPQSNAPQPAALLEGGNPP